MKKITFLFIAMIINVGMFAQHSYKAVNYPIKDNLLEKPLQSTVSVFQQRNVLTTYFTEGFEGADFATLGWSTIDADGDTYDWAIQAITSHTGTNCATSESWNSGAGALTPNNYLISPAIDLTSTTGTLFLEWWVRAQDQSWPSEHYKVLVSTTGTAQGDFTNNLFEETVVPGGATDNKYVVRNVNLTAYAGQIIYLAFVHYNTTDMYRLDIDDVSIYNISTIDGSVTNVVSPNNTSTCQLTSSENVTVTIFNNGGLDIANFPVSYIINGGATVTDTCTQTIAPASSYDFTFSSPIDVSALDIYSLYVYVTIPSDVNASNDAFDYQFVSSDAKITLNAHSDSLGGQSWWVIDNNSLDTFVVDYLGWQWNVDVIRNICVFNDSCYSVTVYDADGMIATNVAYVELLYNDIHVAGSTTPGSFAGPELTANVGNGCGTICFAPTNMNALGITTSSADLSWAAGGSDTLWNVEYGASGFTQGTGTINEVSTNPYTISGLTASTDYDFYVRAICGVGDTSSWAGPFAFATLISCPAPTNLSTSNITASSATLNWTNGGTETAWNIEYGTSGFIQGTGTIVEVTSNPYIISGLTSATTYDFYVRAICGVGDTSLWSGTNTFSTPCDMINTFPYLEDFENGGVIPNCWINEPTNVWDWEFLNTVTSSGGSITADNTSGTGYFAFFNSYNSNAAGDIGELTSPTVDLTVLTTPRLKFFWNRPGNTAYNARLEVNVYANGVWTNDIVAGLDQTTTGWTEIKVNLSSYKYNDFKVQFRIVSDWYRNIGVDDVIIEETPSCLEVSQLNTSNVTNNSSVLSWFEEGTASSWQIAVDTVGFNLLNASYNNVTDTFYNATGLLSSTTYEFYVRAVCGAGDTSAWSGPFSFSTTCSILVAPIVEDFENAGAIPNCWTEATDDDFDWLYINTDTPSDLTGPSADHTTGTGYYAYVESSSPNYPSKIAGLLTPSIDISGLTNPALIFWYNMYGAGMGSLNIDVYDGTWHTDVNSISGDHGDVWTKVIIDLSTYTSPVQIKFRAITGSDYTSDAAIDDISFEEGPTCFEPTALASQNATLTSVDLSWSSSATNWSIEYGTTGFIQGTGTIVTVSANPYTLSGLTASTDYDVYVRAICGAGDSSLWAGPVTFSTPCDIIVAPYVQDFENGGIIPNCWTDALDDDFDWSYTNTTTPSSNTGPSADHTTGTGYYAFVESSDPNYPSKIASLLSPIVDISSLTNPELTFWYNMNGAGMGELHVDIYDGTWNNDVFTQSGDQGDVWTKVNIGLSTYTSPIRVKFRAITGIDWTSDAAIDDILIDAATLIQKNPNINTISIYPNPSTGIVNIRTNENSNVYVYNILGDVVATFNNLSNVSRIDLSNLSEGNYVIKVVSDKESVNKHITIVK